MRRYFITFSYVGTLYRGSQKHITGIVRDHDSIQGTLESAFTTIIPKCIVTPKVYISSRTDHGVHALQNSGHIDLENKYNAIYDRNSILRYINRYLSKCQHDIRLLDFIPVKPNFHSKHIVKSRTYLYRFMSAKNPNFHKVPVLELNNCYHIRPDVCDIERIKRATELFMGLKNFTTFSAKSTPPRPPHTFVRKLNVLTIEKGQPLMPYDPLSQEFDFWHVTCNARSFLYNQVRRMVSALIGVGTGIITETDIIRMLQVPGHHNWNRKLSPVPSHGLFLLKQEFDEDLLNEYTIEDEELNSENTIDVTLHSN